MAAVGISFCVFSAAAYCVGRATASELRFLSPLRAPTYEEASIGHVFEYALRSTEHNDVIFVGHSSCKHGIDPILFEKLTGLSSYNLGTQATSGPPGIVLSTKIYLLQHPKPKVVVLCLIPHAFDAFGEGRCQDQIVASYAPELSLTLAAPGTIPYFVKHGAVSSWLAARSLVGISNKDVRERSFIGHPEETYRTVEASTRLRRGFIPRPGEHGPPAGPWHAGVAWTILDSWDRGMNELADACEAANALLLIRHSPLPRDWLHVRDFGPMEQWLRNFKAAHRNVVVPQPTILWYERDVMFDSYHLNTRGVERFTAQVAKDVQAALSARDRE
jgi:hypothetical protein